MEPDDIPDDLPLEVREMLAALHNSMPILQEVMSTGAEVYGHHDDNNEFCVHIEAPSGIPDMRYMVKCASESVDDAVVGAVRQFRGRYEWN